MKHVGAKLLGLLQVLGNADKLRHIESAEEPQTCMVRPGSKLSGLGQVQDNYYHFLVDYAPKLFNYCFTPGRNSIMYVQDHDGYRLGSPEYPRVKSIFSVGDNQSVIDSTPFDYIFDGRIKVQHIDQASLLKLDAKPIPFQLRAGCKQTDASSPNMAKNECDEWGRQPAQDLDRFRRYMVKKATGSEDAYGGGNDIIVLQRSKKSTQRTDRTINDKMLNAVNKVAARFNMTRFVKHVEFTRDTPLSEQIRVFSNAKMVIANHGAGCSNIMFCKPGTVFLEIKPVNFPCFKNLAERLGLQRYEISQGKVTEDELAPMFKAMSDSREDQTWLRKMEQAVGKALSDLRDDQTWFRKFEHAISDMIR